MHRQLLLLLTTVFLAALGGCQSSSAFTNGGRYSSELGWLGRTRALAQMQLGGKLIEEAADRLAVVVLVTEFDRADRDRVALLRKALGLCIENLFPDTPSSFYVFTNATQVGTLREELGELVLPNVAVLPVDERSWVVPELAGNRSGWHSGKTAKYRLMGDWRLGVLPEFTQTMGHRYVMQLDDDSFITTPVGKNLVQLFDRQGYVLGARNIEHDGILVTWGLPELARYFLTTNKIVPATLFDYCDPPNIDGLYSRFKRSKVKEDMTEEDMDALKRLGLHADGGWNRTILHGNCIMYSLEWRFRTEVHRFVQLCRATGGAFAYRWNEQGVIAMLWQIFVPRDQFLLFDFGYEHRYQGDKDSFYSSIESSDD